MKGVFLVKTYHTPQRYLLVRFNDGHKKRVRTSPRGQGDKERRVRNAQQRFADRLAGSLDAFNLDGYSEAWIVPEGDEDDVVRAWDRVSVTAAEEEDV